MLVSLDLLRRRQKVDKLGRRRLTKFPIIGNPQPGGCRHMSQSSATALTSTQLNSVFTRDRMETVVGSRGRKNERGRIADVHVAKVVPCRWISGGARVR